MDEKSLSTRMAAERLRGKTGKEPLTDDIGCMILEVYYDMLQEDI